MLTVPNRIDCADAELLVIGREDARPIEGIRNIRRDEYYDELKRRVTEWYREMQKRVYKTEHLGYITVRETTTENNRRYSMGILKDIFFGSDKEKRREKTERVDIRDHGEYKSIYDSEGHWKGELRWNPESDRWDKLDSHGDVTGYVERNVSGDMVHKDYSERVTRVDKREDARTVSHYDSKGNKTGYTTKDYSNNLTRHTFVEDEKKNESSRGSQGFLSSLLDAAEEYNRKVAEIRNRYEAEDDEWEEDEDMFEDEYDYDYDPFDDEDDDDPYADEYDEDCYDDDEDEDY